ncbi:MAG: FAD-dependent oxidoreductase, partial [Miltoncostaeaceae bacterium]
VDLIIIGAGMAGMNAAALASDAGLRVAVIERQRVGGTCPLRGCIPSKTLIRSAEVAHLARRAGEFGVRTGEVSVDFAAVMDRVRGVIDRGAAGARGWLESLPGLELIMGEGALVDERTVRVGARTLTAPRILIATGARPADVPIPGLDVTPHMVSDDIWNLTALPERLAIVGAGPVALEFGQAFGRLGSEVTMVEVAPRLLPGAEPELADALRAILEQEGLIIHTAAQITRVEPDGAGVLLIGAAGDGTPLRVEADALLLATGRWADVEALDLAAAGLDGGHRGVPADERLRTAVEGVFAAGDVLGPDRGQFTHVARRQGVHVAHEILGHEPGPARQDIGPAAIFTDPELVTIGLTEAAARDAGHDVRVGTDRFSGGRARALGEEHGSARVVVDADSGLILGAHVLAHHAAELIHPVAVAMRAGTSATDLITGADHIHPTMGEVVKAAVAKAAG